MRSIEIAKVIKQAATNECSVLRATMRRRLYLMSSHRSGRPADKDDVAAGRAVVSASAEGQMAAKPIPNAVPQYAFHVDEAGKRTPGIVIQAEQAGALRLIGFRPLSGEKLIVALEKEFEFLGTDLGASSVRRSR
jgi:hypothetical protein